VRMGDIGSTGVEVRSREGEGSAAVDSWPGVLRLSLYVHIWHPNVIFVPFHWLVRH
jgi:hypothetical protein